jgi:predicted tellurium resistance membrane protein TerC
MFDLVAIFSDPANIAALATLITMEVVLGIDNLIFISILTNKLPEHQRSTARRVGISGALILRLAFLSLIFLIVHLTEPVVTVFDHSFSWRDMILIAGGGFLVWKATKEIHHNVDPEPTPGMFGGQASITFTAAIGQILLLDAVFSIDSIITAIGMTDHIPIMVIAILLTVAVMLLAANPLAKFIHAHPSMCTAQRMRSGILWPQLLSRHHRRLASEGLMWSRIFPGSSVYRVRFNLVDDDI